MWAENTVGTKHASSPQVEVFSDACWRGPTTDVTPANWRYLYVLGPRAGDAGARVTLVSRVPTRWCLVLPVCRAAGVELKFNNLLLYRDEFACSVQRIQGRSGSPISAAVFLAGYLW
jgi:hypothetical protein